MELWILVWCLLGTIFALPMYPQQSGMHGMASMSFESMRTYGSPNSMNFNGRSLRPQYRFGDHFPSWWMHGQSFAFPWMPLRPREHDTQQYEYALPVHPPPLPAQQIPLQPPQPGLQAPYLPQQPTVVPIQQDALQPGQQPPVQQALPTLPQGEQMIAQQQVAPPEGQPQQFPVWEHTGQQDLPLLSLLQKLLQYGSSQPVQLEHGQMQPIQPQLHQGPLQPDQPQLYQGQVPPIQTQLDQLPLQPNQPQLQHGPMQSIQPQIHQGPLQPVHPHLEQWQMQPYYPQLHQGPIQQFQPHLNQVPMQPVDPRLHHIPMQHAYPGLYYLQYSGGPVGAPARLGIVSSEEMQGGQAGGPHGFGTMYPGFGGMGHGYARGDPSQNSAFPGDFTAEDDAPAARGQPTAQGGVVLIQNGNNPVAGPSPPVDGATPPVVIAMPPLPRNTVLIPEGNLTGQINILLQPNSRIPHMGPDPAGQSKLPVGVTPTQVQVLTEVISDNYIPLGDDDTTPIGVQKELTPSIVETTTAVRDTDPLSENKWFFQEP